MKQITLKRKDCKDFNKILKTLRILEDNHIQEGLGIEDVEEIRISGNLEIEFSSSPREGYSKCTYYI